METKNNTSAVKSRSPIRVIFSHGKESNHLARKITALSEIAKEFGAEVESIDYSDLLLPEPRVNRLCDRFAANPGPVIFVGSSMGGYVSLVAATRFPAYAKGIFLMAPALFMGGEYETQTFPSPLPTTVVVHGWTDEVVLFEHSVRFAQEHRADLVLLNDDHRLSGRLDTISPIFRNFLERCMLQN